MVNASEADQDNTHSNKRLQPEGGRKQYQAKNEEVVPAPIKEEAKVVEDHEEPEVEKPQKRGR